MPINIKDTIDPLGLQFRQPNVEEQKAIDIETEAKEAAEPSFMDTLTAGFRLENPVFSGINRVINDLSVENKELDITFDPFQEPSFQNMDLDDDELDEFITVKNKEDYHQRLNAIIDRRKDRDTMERSGIGASLTSYLFAGLTDPLGLVPLGAAVKGIKTGSKLGTTALRTTAAGTLSIGATEASLKLSQRGRTDEEAITNTLAGGVMSAFLGVGAGLISGGEVSKLAAKAKESVSVDPIIEPTKMADFDKMDTGNLSAAKVDDVKTPKGFAPSPNIIGKTLFKVIDPLTRPISPMRRLMNNNNEEIRTLTEELLEIPLETADVAERAARQSVEQMLPLVNKPLGEAAEAQRLGYKEYRKAAKAKGEKVLTELEFAEEVTKANRRLDEHPNKYVAKVAKEGRRTLLKHIEDNAIEVGLLPKDVQVDTALSYISKVRNRAKIIADEPGYKKAIKPWAEELVDSEISMLKTSISKLQKQLSKAKSEDVIADLTSKLDDMQARLRVVDDIDDRQDYIEEILDDVTSKILGFEDHIDIPHIESNKPGPLKGRTLHIPDELEEAFLENDSRFLYNRLARIVNPNIELQRKFGTTKFSEVKKRLADKLKEQKVGLTAKESEELTKETEKGIEDLRHMWDILKGTYKSDNKSPDNLWRRGAAALRDFNYMTKMGSVAIASTPDLGSLIRMGIGSSFKHGLKPVIKNIIKGRGKVNKQAARQIAKAFEAELGTKVASIWEVGDPLIKRGTFIEKAMEYGAAKMGNLNGLNHWNDIMQEVASMSTQQRIIEGIRTGQDTRFLNFLGLDENIKPRILKQFSKHGQDLEDVTLSNTDLWDDKEAVRAFQAAISKQVDRMAIIKKVGDTPIFMNDEGGKIIGQFMNFALASTNRLLLAGLQQGDLSVLLAVNTMIMLGMGVYAFRTPAEKLSEDPEEWIMQGIDRSGILAIPFFAAGIAGQPTAERRLLQGLGASAGTAKDMMKIVEMVEKGSLNQADVKTLRRLLPYQNLIWLTMIEKAAGKRLDELVIEEFNVPKRRKSKKRNLRRQ